MKGLQGEGGDLVELVIGDGQLEFEEGEETRIEFTFSTRFGKQMRAEGFTEYQTNGVSDEC